MTINAFEGIGRDVRHGVRQLLQRPAFAAAAIGSLALGIGLNVTIFSVVNAVLLRGLPLERPDRLVEIYSGLSKDYPQLTTSYPDFQDIERDADALAGLVGSSYVRGIMSLGGKGSLTTGESVTANYFDLLGIPISLGRGFRAEENLTPNAAPVIVVSHAPLADELRRLPGHHRQEHRDLGVRLHRHWRGATKLHRASSRACRPISGCP